MLPMSAMIPNQGCNMKQAKTKIGNHGASHKAIKPEPVRNSRKVSMSRRH